MKESFGRIRRKFVRYLGIGSCLVLVFALIDLLITPGGGGIGLLFQAGIFMIFAVIGAAGFSVYQEIRHVRARKRLEVFGIF